MCNTEGCPYPIENEDTGLCPRCGRLSRKEVKSKKIYVIPKRSIKGKEIALELRKVYKVVDSMLPSHCGNCGSKNVDHSHILPQGQYPEHRLNVINILLDCRDCHLIWEHGTLSEVEKLRDFKKRLAVIKKLAPEYFLRRFKIDIQDYEK